LIGLDYARDGPKAPEFGSIFKMLGVQIDASGATTGSIAVGHTEKRKRELVKTLDEALNHKKLATKLAESIRGRIVFFTNVLLQTAPPTFC
jgi:hypothetical protein